MAPLPLHSSPLLLLALSPAPAFAQANGAAQREQVIVVTGHRDIRGANPERQLGQRDIEAYGVDNVGELIGELSIEGGDSGGSIFLVNGRRISDLGELSDYPAEALQQVDVLGPGAGARIGQPAARRVYNLVLQKRFNGRIGRAAAGLATEGGWSSRRADISYTSLRDQRRFNLRLGVRHEDDLLESERGLIQPANSVADAGRFRTLRPEVLGMDLSASMATPLAGWLSLSTTAKLTFVRSDALLGFSEALSGARDQRRRNVRGRLNTTVNGQRGGWELTLLGRYEQSGSRVLVESDRLVSARNQTFGLGRNAEIDFTASRELLGLPAGPLQLTLGANLAADRTITRLRQSGDSNRSRVSEQARTASVGIRVPLASRSANVLPQLGDVSAAANVGVTRSGASGSALNRQFSLTWQPSSVVRVFGTLSASSAPPATKFRSDPLLETPGVRYYDPLRNETVELTEISGGLATLLRQRSVQRRIGASFTPTGPLDLKLSVDYEHRRDRNLLSNLPQASPIILELFPERFVRGPSGRLTSVDIRPVLFAGRIEREVRSRLNLILPLASSGGRSGEGSSDRDDGAEREGSRSPARLHFNVAHTYLMSSKLDVGGGRPVVDLLSRNAIAFGGGQPRHQVEGSLGLSARGLGLRLTASHRSQSLLELEEAAGTANVLRFGSLTLFNLRAFVNADLLFGRRTWTRGSRFTLSASNLANVRQQVRDDFGATPLAFQPAYREATGRTIELELRKPL
jgi:hypothetical protein